MVKPRNNFYQLRGALVGALLILCLILLPLWWQAGIWYEEKLIVEQKAQDTVDLTIHANTLTTNINQQFALLEGLYAFTLTNPTEEKLDANFDTFTSGLYIGAEGIRNFAIAPDGVIRYVYPLESNENVAGHDIINDERPNVRADVQRAIDTRQIVLSGPYELRQGGLGLVARKALFVNDTFWGLVTMVVDMEPVLDQVDLEIHSDQFIYVGIRDEDGNVFYGDSQAFDSQPVTQRIELPDGYWELARTPIYGWSALVRDEVLIFKGTGLVIVGLITILAYLLINRQSRLAYLVRMGTHELSEANDELKNDITERKITELALQKSEELYRHLVELSPDGIIVHDLERYTFVNNAAAKILGAKTTEELIGRKVLDFIHADYVDIAKQRLSEEKDGKILPFIEEKMLKIDGTSVDVEVAAFPVTHMGTIEVHAIIRDITERKHAQEKLMQSETKFRNYFEKEVVGVAITSPEKGWVEVNGHLCELLGYTSDEMITKTWAEMTYPEDLVPDMEQFNRMLSGEIDSYS
ncbi:MAG: PAS domain S-box protein, partial [Methanosarcinales archaeon]|nr:PAS domain S-box protein [Methanosarcinales archaeon]